MVLCSVTFFSDNCAAYEKMWKQCRTGNLTYDNMRMRIAC